MLCVHGRLGLQSRPAEGASGAGHQPGVSGRRGKTRYNYVRNVVRSAKKFEASRDERMSLMDEQHRFIVEDLEGQLIQLSKENAELREKLKLQPENFFQAITEVRNGRGKRGRGSVPQ